MRKVIILGTCCILAACSSGPHGLQGSIIPLSDQSASLLAYDTTLLVLQQAPARGSVEIQHTAGDDGLFPHLVSDLTGAGYEPVQDRAKHSLQYAVSTVSDGTMLRIRLDGVSAARFYVQGEDHNLVAAGPFSLQEAAE